MTNLFKIVFAIERYLHKTNNCALILMIFIKFNAHKGMDTKIIALAFLTSLLAISNTYSNCEYKLDVTSEDLALYSNISTSDQSQDVSIALVTDRSKL